MGFSQANPPFLEPTPRNPQGRLQIWRLLQCSATSTRIMHNGRPIPTALSVVACLFLVAGIAGLAGTVTELTHGRVHVYGEILGIPIFFGLRRLSRGWRICALIFLWLSCIALFVGIIAPIFVHSPFTLHYLGLDFPMVQPSLLAVISALLLPLVLWQYRVLTRPETRDYFSPSHATNVA